MESRIGYSHSQSQLGSSDLSMEPIGYPWRSMGIHGYPWISVDIHGHPWTMDIHEYLWIGQMIPTGFGYGYSQSGIPSYSQPIDWALVSNLGFLKFQIFRFSILEFCFVLENLFEKYVGEISRNK